MINQEDKFLWGSATAAYQCEGAWDEDGKTPSIWDVFNHSQSHHNVNNTDADISCDFYHRFEEDIKMMAEGGQNTFRFSISPSRIYSDHGAEINQKGIEFYNKVIDTCLSYGIEPFVTLFHYDLPYEVYVKGGWMNRENIDWFVEYSRICFENFGDRVSLWTTINEPRYYTYCGYIAGNYPPNHDRDFNGYWRQLYHLALATAKVTILFKEMGIDGQIGFVNDSGFVEVSPETKNKEHVYKTADLFLDRFLMDLAVIGKMPEDALELIQESGVDISWYREDDMKYFEEGKIDFIGQNAYTRMYVTDSDGGETEIYKNNLGAKSKVKEGMRIKGWFQTAYDPNVERNYWGREVRPKSAYHIVMKVKERYGDLPIYITENGHGDYDQLDNNDECQDNARIEFLDGFINEILKAKQDGANVKGYYVWSTMDLYSWINGYDKRYGLVYVDYENNNKRIPKQSYYWYKEKIAEEQRKENKK